MVSALVPGASGPGSSPGWGHHVVFLGNTLSKLLAKPNKLSGNDLPWTSIPSRGSRSTPCRFMLQKLGISSGSYDPAGSQASFFFM